MHEGPSANAAADGIAALHPPAETTSALTSAPEWRLAKKLGFRVLFCYVILYALEFLFGAFPWTTDPGNQLFDDLIGPSVAWVGANVLGIDYPFGTGSNGSGDRTYHHVLLFCHLVLAIAMAGCWSLVDRRSRDHRRLFEGLRIFVRVYVGAVMLSYGFAKIFYSGQFPPLTPGLLARTYGESSPMSLLWSFMGASTPYRMFAGYMEAIPGFLLFFRRTTTVGALILLGVMGNVVLLNLCYDVPVKLFSSHIWLLCLFLTAPAWPRLMGALLLNRTVLPTVAPRLFSSHRAYVMAAVLYWLAIASMTFEQVRWPWARNARQATISAENRKLIDLHEVVEMTVDGQLLPPAPSDATRWRRVRIRDWGLIIYWMNGKSEMYISRADGDIAGPMILELQLGRDSKDTPPRARLELRRELDGYTLEGEFEGRKVRAYLANQGAENSVLMNRGFHWISEEPFNR